MADLIARGMAKRNTDKLSAQSVVNLVTGDINVQSRKESYATVTFISDDGFKEDYSILKPIFQAQGVPFAVAIVSGWIGDYRSMSISQIRELQSMGCEILCHTKSHPMLANLTEAEIETELKESKMALKELGFDANHIVYPGGSYNSLVKRVARKYYRAGYTYGNTGQTNKQPYDSYAIKRVALGAYFDPVNAEFTITNTFNDYYKPMVDRAAANKEWLIFTLHPGASSGEFTATQQDYLVQTIQYIKSLGISIQNPSAVLNELGNMIDVVSYAADSTERYFKVGGNGDVASTTPFQPKIKILETGAVNALSDQSAFNDGYVSHCLVTTANSAGTPNGVGGVLVTNKTVATQILITQNLSTQTFYERKNGTTGSGNVYTRSSNDSLSWGEWRLVSTTDTNGYQPQLKNSGVVVNSQKTALTCAASLAVDNKWRLVINVSVVGDIITNLTNGVEGQEVILLNTSANNITLKNVANANDGNITLVDALDFTLKRFQPVRLVKFTSSWYLLQ